MKNHTPETIRLDTFDFDPEYFEHIYLPYATEEVLSEALGECELLQAIVNLWWPNAPETDKATIKWEKLMDVVYSLSLDDVTFINFSLRRYLKKHPNADANKFTRRRYNRYFKRLVKPILKEYNL